MTRRAALAFAVGFLISAAYADATELPVWARPALSSAPEDGAAATVLLDDVAVAVGRDGRVRTTQRYVVRINRPEGTSAAVVRQVYIDGSGKVTGLKAWVQPVSGAVLEYGGRDAFEVALVDNDLYNEVRAKGISASSDVEPGAIFAAEVELEERGLFAQLEWHLQGRWPVRYVRRTLVLPQGWSARSVTFNRASIAPQVSGSTYVWETHGLSEIHEEDAAPPLSSLVPRIAVSYFGTAGEQPHGQFASWADVAGWLATLAQPSQTLSESLAATARELVSGAPTELEKIRAIGRFVQRIQYVSIQTGLGRGGGYQPRPASQTLDKRYGDCKDKANLMRALLAAVGIKAHLVAIYSGDPRYVREEWPSPQQFNHCIIAIVLGQATGVEAVITHPVHGRLLFFDPTDERGRVGELPLSEQGSLALLQVSGGTLERMPVLPAADSRLDRSVEASLDSTGALKATVVERAFGREAAAARARAAATNVEDLRRDLEAEVAAMSPGAVLLQHAAGDAQADEQYTVRFEARAPRYGQLMQGRLMIVKPPATAGLDAPALSAATRRHPVDLETHHAVETIALRLPQGFAIDELPQPATLESPYGRFVMTVERSDDGVIMSRRQFELRRALVPAAEYDSLRLFFDKVREAASAPIVLMKQ
jgi:hypothetical protein